MKHVVLIDGISESAVVDVFEGGEGTHGFEEGSWVAPLVVEFIASRSWLLLELAWPLKAFAPPKEIFIPVLLLCPEPLKGPCH